MISDFIKKLIFVNAFNIGNGKDDMLGERHILLPSEVIAKINIKSSFAAIRNQVKASTSSMAKKLGVKDAKEFNKNFKDVFMTYGLGIPEIVDLDMKNRRAIVKVRQGPVANIMKGKTKGPACQITSAILSGMFSYILKKDVVANETNCEARGEDFCQFVIK